VFLLENEAIPFISVCAKMSEKPLGSASSIAHNALFDPQIITLLLAGRTTHAKQVAASASREKKRMVAAVLELPASGYVLEVDGCMKTAFQTRDGARAGRRNSRSVYPCFGSESTMQRQRPAKRSIEPPAA
jgi:hypothetical protein